MLFTILENAPLAPAVYKLVLEGDTRKHTKPGMFVNIRLDGFFLRRPISVCDWDERAMTLIYKVVGHGTEALAQLAPGHTLDLLTGLGNGFDVDVDTEAPLIVGGGVGVPPLYNLAKQLTARGLRPMAILGFNAAPEVFYEREFRALGADVHVCTVDGSYGTHGFVTAAMREVCYDHLFACGPEPMLRAVYHESGQIPGQLSFEERMGCGFGACMGCSCETLTGYKRICVEGPVLMKEEIKWRT